MWGFGVGVCFKGCMGGGKGGGFLGGGRGERRIEVGGVRLETELARGR